MTGMTQVFLIFFQVSPRFPALLILLILLVPRASQDFPRLPKVSNFTCFPLDDDDEPLMRKRQRDTRYLFVTQHLTLLLIVV